MNVGIYCAEIVPSQGGGYTFTSEVLQAVLNLLSESSHNFVVISHHPERPQILSSSTQVGYFSVEASPQERLRYKLSFLKTTIRETLKHPRNLLKTKPWRSQFVEDQLVANHIDVVWSIGDGFLSMEVPYIMTVWDLQHRLQPYFPEMIYQDSWNKREHGWNGQGQGYATSLRRAAAVLTGTEVGKAEIERFYQVPSERVKVLPFPVPQFALTAPPSDDQHLLDTYQLKNGYLFYPAQFWTHKNHVNLLLAIQRLRDESDLSFQVAFSGADQGNLPYIQELVEEMGLSAQVRFLGFVPQEDLIALYRNAFALTFVTFFGPDNLPPLEAFALGCPVIASNVSGAQEQLEDAALLVDPKDPEQIAAAIKLLWEDSALRQTLIDRGKARSSRQTREGYVRGVFEILDEFSAIRRCWRSSSSVAKKLSE